MSKYARYSSGIQKLHGVRQPIKLDCYFQGLLGDDQESDSMDGHIIMNFDITESSSQISNEVLERQMSRLR